MVLAANYPFPYQDPIANLKREGLVSDPWIDAFTSLTQTLASLPGVVASVSGSNLAADVTLANLTSGVSGGVYRLSYYIFVMQAPSISGTVDLELDWTSNGTVRRHTKTLSAAGGVGTEYVTEPLLVRLDALTPVTYELVWASSGGTDLEYGYDILLEEVKA